jgi:hypothetical protein
MAVNVRPELLTAVTPLTAMDNPTAVLTSRKLLIINDDARMEYGWQGSVHRKPGRMVRFRAAVNGIRQHNDRLRVEDLRHENTMVGPIEAFALVNPEVAIGDTVVAWNEIGPKSTGVHGVVTQSVANVIEIEDAEGVNHRFLQYWALAGEPAPLPEIAPEDMEISDWWVERILAAARKAKSLNRWCSETNGVINELLAPARAARGFKVTEQVGDLPFEVQAKDGKVVAAFASPIEANADAAKRNEALYKF